MKDNVGIAHTTGLAIFVATVYIEQSFLKLLRAFSASINLHGNTAHRWVKGKRRNKVKTQIESISSGTNRAVLMAAIFLAVAAPCILYVKGTIATIFIVLYCIGAALPATGVLFQIFNAKGTGMRVGLYIDKDGQQKMSMEKYKEFTDAYEIRFSLIAFWVSCVIRFTWIAVFLIAGIEILAYIMAALTLLAEIGKYRVYKAIKDNKTAWGAAMYLNEISSFFKEKAKE